MPLMPMPPMPMKWTRCEGAKRMWPGTNILIDSTLRPLVRPGRVGACSGVGLVAASNLYAS